MAGLPATRADDLNDSRRLHQKPRSQRWRQQTEPVNDDELGNLVSSRTKRKKSLGTNICFGADAFVQEAQQRVSCALVCCTDELRLCCSMRSASAQRAGDLGSRAPVGRQMVSPGQQRYLRGRPPCLLLLLHAGRGCVPEISPPCALRLWGLLSRVVHRGFIIRGLGSPAVTPSSAAPPPVPLTLR